MRWRTCRRAKFCWAACWNGSGTDDAIGWRHACKGVELVVCVNRNRREKEKRLTRVLCETDKKE
jgi:hypothetical protein